MVDPRVFRNYDIRGIVPDLVDEDSLYFGKENDPDAYQAQLLPEDIEQIGRGLADMLKSDKIAVGRDSRNSGESWLEALTKGINSQGVDVVDIGLCPSEVAYYVSGKYNWAAIEITASHCTRELNGLKIVRAGVDVVGQGTGMEELRDIVLKGQFHLSAIRGTSSKLNVVQEYVDHILELIDVSDIGRYEIVADAGNGVGGIVADALMERIPQIKMHRLFFELDGRFPNHEPNPFEPENRRDLVNELVRTKANMGVAWDGDADRVFFLDECGQYVSGDFITALVSQYFLAKSSPDTIVYDLRSSWAVRDWVERMGGRAVPERVGHSYMKATMRKERAVFGGEVSGHYYFRDHYYADNGYIPFLAILKMLSAQSVKMSELVASLGDYYISGEINSTVPDTKAVIARITEKYSDGEISYLDGITVNYSDWHFNVRPSANDPVVRLNLEAKSQADMERRRDEVLALIRQDA